MSVVSRSSPSADEQEQTAGKVGDDESRKSDGWPPREGKERKHEKGRNWRWYIRLMERRGSIKGGGI